jgi:hypothetical protein
MKCILTTASRSQITIANRALPKLSTQKMLLEPKAMRTSRELWLLARPCEVRKQPPIVAAESDPQIAEHSAHQIAVATRCQAGWLFISTELRGRAAR